MYCMVRITTYIYFGQAIECNDPVALASTFLMLLHLDSKYASIIALLAVQTVYKIMNVLGSNVIIVLLFAYLLSHLQFGFSRPSSTLFSVSLRPSVFDKY